MDKNSLAASRVIINNLRVCKSGTHNDIFNMKEGGGDNKIKERTKIFEMGRPHISPMLLHCVIGDLHGAWGAQRSQSWISRWVGYSWDWSVVEKERVRSTEGWIKWTN